MEDNISIVKKRMKWTSQLTWECHGNVWHEYWMKSPLSLREKRKSTITNTVYYLPKGFPGGSDNKESSCNAGNLGWILGHGDPLEKGRATHSGILALRIPWTKKPGRSVSHTESDTAEWITPVFLPWEFHGQRSLAGYSLWVTQSRTQLSESLYSEI